MKIHIKFLSILLITLALYGCTGTKKSTNATYSELTKNDIKIGDCVVFFKKRPLRGFMKKIMVGEIIQLDEAVAILRLKEDSNKGDHEVEYQYLLRIVECN